MAKQIKADDFIVLSTNLPDVALMANVSEMLVRLQDPMVLMSKSPV